MTWEELEKQSGLTKKEYLDQVQAVSDQFTQTALTLANKYQGRKGGMKRLGLWITFLLVMAMVISAWSYHVGFQDGYDFAAGATTSKTVSVAAVGPFITGKIICHGPAACEEAGY